MRTAYFRSCLVLLSGLLLWTACSKRDSITPPVPTPIRVTDLKDSAIGFQRFALYDLDGDGTRDLSFGTMLVGDPLLGVDKKWWLISAGFDTHLPIREEALPVLRKGDSIPVRNWSGYEWYNGNTVILAERWSTVPVQWWGSFQQADHAFIAFRLQKSTGLYYGWVEVSYRKATEQLILHRAALAETAGVAIRAGQE